MDEAAGRDAAYSVAERRSRRQSPRVRRAPGSPACSSKPQRQNLQAKKPNGVRLAHHETASSRGDTTESEAARKKYSTAPVETVNENNEPEARHKTISQHDDHLC